MPLLDVDAARGTFDHVCVNCKRVARGLSLERDVQHVMPMRHHMAGTDPKTLYGHEVHLLVLCSCNGGRSGEFFMDLGPEHADVAQMGGYAWRAQQIQMTRAAKAHKGLPLTERGWTTSETPLPMTPAPVVVDTALTTQSAVTPAPAALVLSTPPAP